VKPFNGAAMGDYMRYCIKHG